ncbi:hypothetical protein HHI36_006479 [Cryptolaemus montrouzieri]|uniref:Cytochrome P450 n=1 Tax=Cryptolaemus montrouzieri TaxID=559131 RepID=A0ABD2NYA8_9CUCU
MASSGEILVAFLLLGFVIWRYIKQKTSFHKLLVHLPGPEKNLIFGNMLEFKSSTVFLPKLCEYRDKYGDIFKLWVGPTFLSIIISDYKLLEALLCSNKNLYKSWQYKYLNNWLGQGLLTSEPIRWKKHRKLFTPAFHFQILEKFVEMFEKPTTTLIKILEKKIDLNSVDIYHLINLWSLDIMCETSMGTTLNAQENSECEYVHAVKEMGKIIMNRSFSPAKHYDFFYIFSKDYYKEKAALKILHGFTNSMIQQRRSELKKLNDSTENEKADYYRQRKMTFLEVLLLSHIAGKPLSDKAIREEVDTFLFEGHDTITSAVSFALYCLATHKDVQDKVVEEQTEIFGADKNPTVQMGIFII